ncbi:SNF1 protein kinase subunit beta-3 [Spathaspora sp. JA1]|nr:SNF1 protein kinase subunit beta-3 [Spathaspora sp. JA1]
MGNTTSSHNHATNGGGLDSSASRKSSVRKESSNGDVRKSAASHKVTSLDEEFSDLILHQVKPTNSQQSTNISHIHDSQTTLLQQGGGGGVGRSSSHVPEQQSQSSSQNIHSKQHSQQSFQTQHQPIKLFNPHAGVGLSESGVSNGSEQSTEYHNFTHDLIEDEYNELDEVLMDTDVASVSRNFLPDEELTESMEVEEEPDHAFNNDVSSTPVDLSKVEFTKVSNGGDATLNTVPVNPFPRHPNTATAPFAPQNRLSPAQIARNAHSPSPNPEQQAQNSQQQFHQKRFKSNSSSLLIPVEIKWVNSSKEHITKISIIGSFSSWRDVIKLYPSPKHDNEYVTNINLPLGVHKLLYIINNEYRVSDQLPTATDQEGIFFNWFEVIDDTHLFNHSVNQPNHIGASTDYDANIIAGKQEVDRIKEKSNSFLQKLSKETLNVEHVEHVEKVENNETQDQQHYVYPNSYDMPYDMSTSSTSLFQPVTHLSPPSPPPPEYSNEIPEMFVNYDYFKLKAPDFELAEPPHLPPHLNNVLLNKLQPSGNPHHHPPPLTPTHSTNSIQHSSYMQPSTSAISTTSTGSFHNRPPLRRADSSYYASSKESSIPNHVILNHLMTTSIRNDVLTVACITRYSGKFVTQIVYSPADKT